MKINLQFDITTKKILSILSILFLIFIIYIAIINRSALINYFKNIFYKEDPKITVINELTTEEIRDISKSIVLLECLYDTNDDGQWDEDVYGSGTYIPIDIVNPNYDSKNRPTDQNDRYILTNAHLTQLKQKTKDGHEFNFCHVGGENGEKKTLMGSRFEYDSDSIKYSNDNDFALLYHADYNKPYTTKPDEQTLAKQRDKLLKIKPCDNTDLIGRKVYLFGYPGAAYEWETEDDIEKNNQERIDNWNQNKEEILEKCKKLEKNSFIWKVSECDGPYTYNEPRVKEQNLIVTEGIISGTTDDGLNFYTSAKIDSGNSGGLAVSKVNNEICIVGVPTWLSQGEYNNLAMIQSWEKIKELFR